MGPRSRRTATCTLTMVLLAATACGGNSSERSDPNEPVKLGATFALTGELAEVSELYKRGFELGIEQVNEDGGILGKPVEAVTYDDGGEPEKAVSLYSRLLQRDQVDALVGPVGTDLVLAASAVADESGVPLLNIAGADPAVFDQGFEHVFGVLPSADLYPVGAVEIAAAAGLETFATLTIDDSFARSAVTAAEDLATEQGLTAVAQEEIQADSSDFTPLLQKLKSEEPDVLFLGSQLGTSVEILNQMKQIGFMPEMLWDSGGAGSPEFEKLGGDLTNYVMGAAQWNASIQAPGIDEFVSAYKEKYGEEPGYHSATAYGAVYVYKAAYEAVGSKDPTEIADWLRTNQVSTAYGQFAVDPETGAQTALDPITIQWVDGNSRIVWPATAAEAEAVVPAPSWSDR